MMAWWKRALAVAVAVAVAGGLSAPLLAGGAQAATVMPHRGDPRSGHGSANDVAERTAPAGWVIVESGPLTDEAGAQTFGQVACPGRKVVYSGGVYSDSASKKVAINSSYPVDDQSWGVRIDNASEDASTFTVYAVCARQTTKWSIQSASQTAPPGHEHALGVECPLHTKVLGGGDSTDSAGLRMNLNSTWPYTTGHAYGWDVYLNNLDKVDHVMTVYALCGGAKGWQIRQTGPLTIASGRQTFMQANCPLPQVPLGGGVYNDFNDDISLHITVSTTWPNSAGWGSWVSNSSGSVSSITGYVVCAGSP